MFSSIRPLNSISINKTQKNPYLWKFYILFTLRLQYLIVYLPKLIHIHSSEVRYHISQYYKLKILSIFFRKYINLNRLMLNYKSSIKILIFTTESKN